MAVGCMLVLMLRAMGLTSTGAVPIPRPLRVLPGARGCHMALFQSLSPQELQAFKKVWERPVALEAELALTLKVLGAMADSALGDVLDQPLHMLHHIHSELQACVVAQPTAGLRPRGRLRHWLHRLQETPKKESQSCLEASVTFNLFRLLIWDLKCVASGGLYV